MRQQTVAAAATQFGYNNDYVGLVPLPDEPDAALLVVNHEYTDEQLMYPTGLYDADTVKRLSMAYHGLSVVKIRRGDHAGVVAAGQPPPQRAQPPPQQPDGVPHRRPRGR